MVVEEIENSDKLFSLLLKGREEDFGLSDKEREKIIAEINGAIGYVQACYLGKYITVPRIAKAKKNISKQIDELLRYVDTGTSTRDKGIKAFHQAVSFSKEDEIYFGQLACGLIQLKNGLKDFYDTDNDFKKASQKGAKKDDFDYLINCLLGIYKRYNSKFKISVSPHDRYRKNNSPVLKDNLIKGSTIDFVLFACSHLTFHGRNRVELKNKIKNCYDKYPKN